MVHIPDNVSDQEATLIVTAGTAMCDLDLMGGLIVGDSVVVTGQSARMVNRGGRIPLAAFPHEKVPVDLTDIVSTYSASAAKGRAPLAEVPTAIRYAGERIEEAIKVVGKTRSH
jgi:hypothetical protein